MTSGDALEITGTNVTIEAVRDDQAQSLRELDWLRSLHPGMGGPVARPISANAHLVRSTETGAIVGVLDAAGVPGYGDVANVSIYTDTRAARGGWALEALGRFVLGLFESGTRLVHHEVLEFNRPIQRILAGLGVEQSARLRSHAYAAGRHWDVLVYSYDRAHFDHIVEHVIPRTGRLLERERDGSR